ncbi:hypothetical protein GJV52_12075 [Neisseria brasiliensis]|uniref:Uncharacterized protein n=2 Tax=Neisseria brasiliensis TaxID=2666100 RepID=A0A5Q3S2L8_9NEIS|nr:MULTISPECIES: hypothetical protein [Neisseria]MRN39204.1 hypothetical protein [Neisseria brasiliensis]QGL26195.1 hypothetical protein GJV52_12075 [Neisseria brasiliensis]
MDIPSIIDSLGQNEEVTVLIAAILAYSVRQLKIVLCNKNFLKTVKTLSKDKDAK